MLIFREYRETHVNVNLSLLKHINKFELMFLNKSGRVISPLHFQHLLN